MATVSVKGVSTQDNWEVFRASICLYFASAWMLKILVNLILNWDGDIEVFSLICILLLVG